MATDTQKMTKADLRDALAIAETNIAISEAVIEDLNLGIVMRDERIDQLQHQNYDQRQRAARLEEDLRHNVAWATQVSSDIELEREAALLEREAASLIDDALAIDVESMFGHLHFAVSALASITAYSGDNAEVCRGLALVAAQEMHGLVEHGLFSGRFTANGALSAAIAGANEAMSVAQETSDDVAAKRCGGCGGGC